MFDYEFSVSFENVQVSEQTIKYPMKISEIPKVLRTRFLFKIPTGKVTNLVISTIL